ncbi:MAG: mercury methylation ferredoxin HgcB [Desulfurivibrionaceae bacterium]
MTGTLRYLKDVSSLNLDQDRCIGCGLCTIVCPQAVLTMIGDKADIADLNACMECGACTRNCPTGAIQVEAGVGCAAAVINTALGRSGEQCCCRN